MSGKKTQALELLGSGVSPAQTALALGVSESLISQFMSEEEFSTAVVQKRYEKLAKYDKIDSVYDDIEAKLLEKLKDCLVFMTDSNKILRAIQVINGAKRRGSVESATPIQHQEIVTINMPTKIVNNYISQTSITNQITRVGDTDLVTIQPAALLKLKDKTHDRAIEAARP